MRGLRRPSRAGARPASASRRLSGLHSAPCDAYSDFGRLFDQTRAHTFPDDFAPAAGP